MAKKGKLLFVSILVLLVLLGIDIYRRETARKEMIQGYQQQELENQEKMTFKVSDSAINTQAGEQIDSFSVLSGASTGDVLVSSEEFSERAVAQYTRSTRSSTLRYEIADDTLESDIVVLQFEAYTQHDEVDITVNFAGIETELTITSTPHAYYIPVCGAAEISELSFRQDHQAVNDDQVTIGAVYVVDYGTKYPISQLKTGTYELSGGGTTELNSLPRTL